MPVVVTLPQPPVRTAARLIDVAIELTEGNFDGPSRGWKRWPMDGVTWVPWQFDRATVEESACDTTYDKQGGDLPEAITQLSFLLWRSLVCSTLSGMRSQLAARVDYSLDELRSAAYAYELETAADSGSHGLVGDSEYPPEILTTSAASLAAAFVALEDHLAAVLNNGLGVIHLTAGLYSLAVTAGFVRRDGRTATGHLVVGDAGHTGQAAPEGESAAGDGEAWIYATGPIFFAETPVTPALAGDDLDYTRNIDGPLAERHAMIVFDPNLVGAALVDIAASTTGGSGGDIDGGGA